MGKIYVTSALIHKLSIPISSHIKVRCGSKEMLAKLVIKNNKSCTYMLSPELAKALLIKKRKRMLLRYDRDADAIHLGPTIGILSSSLPNRAEFDPKSVQAELIFLSNVGKTLPGQVYIFTPSSINWSDLTTRGYVYKASGSNKGIWVSAVYPLPDVVYDRVASRKGEAKLTIKQAKSKLMRLPHLKYFNPSFLNKWKVHETLYTNLHLREHLPETKSLNQENLQEMLSKYKTLYLKPSNGSLGMGIIKVSKNHNGTLSYVVHGRKRFSSHADDAEDLLKRVKKQTQNRSYIVQQGLNLAKYNGGNFDVRIIYQKNRKGEWQITKKFVRVAPRGSTVANLARGGTPAVSKKVFKNIFKRTSVIEEKNRLIKDLCKAVAQTLELSQSAYFGELGLDIGIDKQGKIWLIEVNSKPRKTTETELSQVIVKNTFRRPLEYSVYLAGFKLRK